MEDKYIAGIMIATIAILVGLAFWQPMASNIGTMTQTASSRNVSFTMPAVGVTKELTMCGQKALTYSIINATDAIAIPTTNYTITSSASSDGFLIAKITGTNGANFFGLTANMTCTYEPRGYIDNGGSRAMVSLIGIAMALLIMIAAVPDLREWIGGVVFIFLALLYIVGMWGRFPLMTYVIISGPLALTGILFLLNWRYRKNLRVNAKG